VKQKILVYLQPKGQVLIPDFEEAKVSDGTLRIYTEKTTHVFPLTSVLYSITSEYDNGARV
jgi:hypothetical protein